MSDAQISKPIPLTGQRTLTKKEQAQCVQATAGKLPVKKSSCTGQVFLGMFFDGTGNNRDVDLPEHKHSNVVRLFRVHKDNSRALTIAPPVLWRREYVPGVGTAFPEIGEMGNSARQRIAGKALANGGQSRIFWGLIQTINAMHRYVKGGEPLMSDAEAGEFAQDTGDSSADSALDELKARVSILKGILSKSKPTVTQFNISVFGFSRGAAQARAYCTWFYQLCEKEGKDYKFAGVSVSIDFLGIFDTVASVGKMNLDVFKEELGSGHEAWAKGTLKIDPAIKRCVHFVATHEVRSTFPLDSVRHLGVYPSNCVEVVYPGAHSDVGGGYKPLNQGKSALPQDMKSYSFIGIMPCIDMHKEAIANGVPLRNLSQMTKEELRDFTASPHAVEDYNAYLKTATASGSLEKVFAQQMNRYLYYRFKKRDTFVDEAVQRGSPSEDTKFLKITNEDLKKKYVELQRKYANVKKISAKNEQLSWAGAVNGDNKTPEQRSADLKKLEKQYFDTTFYPEDLEMWESMHRVGALPESLVQFYDKYVHDSIANLAQDGVREYEYNGRGHFRRRTVYDKGGK